MDDILFQEIPEAKREDMLDANCDEKIETSYLRRFSQEELDQARKDSADRGIHIAQLEDELKETRAAYEEKLKPQRKLQKETLECIKSRGEQVRGFLYKMVDVEKREVGFYDSTGHLVERRKALPSEMQRNIFQINREREAM